jgi:hypothetical protein
LMHQYAISFLTVSHGKFTVRNIENPSDQYSHTFTAPPGI